jgi:microcystin-dependent protein
MTSPFVAEIRMFPFNFPPKGWAFCDGQLLPLSQNTALFSLLGTTYGGDGKSNFALPNLQGNAALHTGANQPGPGLSVYDLGEQTGVQNVTLLTTQIPIHQHTLNVDPGTATTADPTNNFYDAGHYDDNAGHSGQVDTFSKQAPDATLRADAIAANGGGLPHNNMMPYLTLNFCIALQGIFPPRS